MQEVDGEDADVGGDVGRVFLVVDHGVDHGDVRVVELTVGAEVSLAGARVVRRGRAILREELEGEDVVGGARRLVGGDSFSVGEERVVVATVSAPSAASPHGVIVCDGETRDVLANARRVARVDAAVLVVGELGVGKEVVARELHAWSSRAAGPFVRVECASLPEMRLERELFGHPRGALVGRFEAARGGTLFLDHIEHASLGTQGKLVAALEASTVVRLGRKRPRPVDVRVVCATSRDLRAAVDAARFDPDLFDRLHAFSLEVLPLHARTQGIAPLARLFVRTLGELRSRPALRLAPETIDALTRHGWPGNVRELRDAIEHAVVHADGEEIEPRDLPESIGARGVQR